MPTRPSTRTSRRLSIVSMIRRGTTVDNTAFAALSTAGASTFHEIDLLTGRAGTAGRFSRGTVVIGIAVLLS